MDGIIVIAKEKGFTSFDVVAKMRGICQMKKIGHTGTLDPDATGVLPICLGKATKVCDMLTDSNKQYEAVLHLGIETDTQDISGTVLNTGDVSNLDEKQVKEVIASFIGKQQQIPPMYSALKVNGKKLYEYAREGVEIERKARDIEIINIEIKDISLPFVTMVVDCSKGTYIRTLCHDIGIALSTFGCMESLKRTKAAGFTLNEAKTLSEIEEYKNQNQLESLIIPVDRIYTNYNAFVVKENFISLAKNGNKLESSYLALKEDGSKGPSLNDRECIRVYLPDETFIGIYEYYEGFQIWKPKKLFFI